MLNTRTVFNTYFVDFNEDARVVRETVVVRSNAFRLRFVPGLAAVSWRTKDIIFIYRRRH